MPYNLQLTQALCNEEHYLHSPPLNLPIVAQSGEDKQAHTRKNNFKKILSAITLLSHCEFSLAELDTVD